MSASIRALASFTVVAATLLARSALAGSPEWVVPTPDPAPAPAEPERPHREGFTFELGIGLADTYVSNDGAGAGRSKLGLAPLSASIGTFVTPDVALLLRAAGTSYFDNGSFSPDHQIVNGFYGLHVQYWVNDHVMLSGGPGFTLLSKNAFYAGGDDPEGGYGASFRVAVAPLATKHHALRIAAEVFPSRYAHTFVMGSALSLEWQYY